MRQVSVIAGLLLACTGLFAQAQPKDSVSSPAQNQQERCGLKKLDQCLKDLAHDQAGIWTSPLRVNAHDAIWLVPFAGATGAAFAYDQDALRQVGTTNKSLVDRSETISEFGSPYATFGEAGALYVLGALKHNDHLRETGILGAEAVANASLVAEGLKLATNRERPNEGIGTGRFWPHGTRDYSLDSSFPSGHAAASWALARVIAAEYPGWWTKLGAYSFATAISASRITGRQHFPSDVVVGSTFGYLIGGYVVRHHSSADQAKTTYTLLPTFDRAPHAYGVTLILTRNARQVEGSEQLVKDLSPLASPNQEPETKPQIEEVPPAPPSASPSQDDSEGKQSNRILWVIPNYRAVSANTQLPPLSLKNKFWLATQDSFDYSSFILAGALAGIGQARNSTPQFRQGAAGYARYYWHSFADQALGNYLTEAIVPAATREDPRYCTLGHGGFFRRTGYAASRLLITKTDSAGRSFNFSEIVGNGAGAGISNLYYPAQERTWTKTQQKWLTQLAIDGVFNIFKEFWPDINRTVFRGHY